MYLITRLSHSICTAGTMPVAFILVMPILSIVFVLRKPSINNCWMNEMFHLFQETIFSHNLCPLNGFKSDSSIFKNTLYLASFPCYRATGTLETISSKPLFQMKKWSLESQNLANLANVCRCCSDSNQVDPPSKWTKALLSSLSVWNMATPYQTKHVPTFPQVGCGLE